MKVELCKFAGVQNSTGLIKIKPIGITKNIVKKPTLSGWQNIVSKIVINKEYAKGLDGIEDYSHIIVIYWLNKESECHIKHHPQGRSDVPYIGIFACRCPQRPNPIAISTVSLVKRQDNTLTVKGLDILDATPILDIKPYTPIYDEVKNPRSPSWVKRLVF